MNRLIGITGGMATGKSTIAKEIIKLNPDYIYVDVDLFRRQLFNDSNYVKSLKEVIPTLNEYENIDTNILNKYIYENDIYMQEYKKVLYKYLINYLNEFDNKTILVDWALIINDKLDYLFDKIIFLKASYDIRLSRLTDSDLPSKDIEKRFKLQEIEVKNKDNILIYENEGVIDIARINNFLNGMLCKFTLPNNEKKAIFEITHQCNYNCSYCIFSCNSKKIENELTKEECYHVIDELVKNGFKHLKITGGEPFIRKDIIDILKYAASKLIVDISTNASLITDKIVDELNEINLKMIHVSLDGNEYQHESVRGINTYTRTMKGLEALKRSKNKVRIGSVIHLNNENNLEELVKLADEVSANEIIFSIMEPVSGQDRSLVKTIPNEELINILDTLKDKYKDNIIVNYNFGKQPNYVHKCPGGDEFIYINNLGQVSPCPWVYEADHKFISSCSLRNNTLTDVLKDEELKLFMQLKKEGKCYGKI